MARACAATTTPPVPQTPAYDMPFASMTAIQEAQ